MSRETHSFSKVLPDATAKEDLFTADGWYEVVLLHTAAVGGDLYITTETGKLTASNSFNLPMNTPVRVKLSPGTKLLAQSQSGARVLSVFATPLGKAP